MEVLCESGKRLGIFLLTILVSVSKPYKKDWKTWQFLFGKALYVLQSEANSNNVFLFWF